MNTRQEPVPAGRMPQVLSRRADGPACEAALSQWRAPAKVQTLTDKELTSSPVQLDYGARYFLTV